MFEYDHAPNIYPKKLLLVELPPTNGIVNVASAPHPDIAPRPTLVMLLGIYMLFIDVLSLKQFSHISLTVFPESVVGTVTAVAVPKYLTSATASSFFSTYSQSAVCCGNPATFHIVVR